MPAPRAIKIALEGNVSAGKSTFLRHLQANAGSIKLSVVEEQIEKWRNVGGENLLEQALHGDKEAVANFQHYALFTTMLANSRADPTADLIITDRSLLTQFHVFWKALKDSDGMSKESFVALQSTLDLMISSKMYTEPVCQIYIRLSPQECLKRCRQRGRFEERDYTLEYFETIHKQHEQWLGQLPPGRVWVVEAEGLSESEMDQKAGTILAQIVKDFILTAPHYHSDSDISMGSSYTPDETD